MKKTVFISASVALFLIFIASAFFFKAEKAEQAELLIAQNQAGLSRDYSPALGPTAGKVRITEFLDPACETCRRFYPIVKEMLNAHPDDIHLTLRYAPFHENSDYVVALLYAAGIQGKHWETLEALLNSQDEWVQNHAVQKERVWQYIASLDLNLEQLKNDMTSPAIAQQIAQDLADAAALNVSKTPDFFVNGKPLPSFGVEPLKNLVDAALANAAR